MSDGIPVPIPWPPAINETANYPVILIDEGTFIDRHLRLKEQTTASLVVRVEGLPDDDSAICLAIDAAIEAHPTHPCEDCLVLMDAGPLFGNRHTKGNSMVAGRGMTTDTDAVLGTGTTGTIVIVKLSFVRQPNTPIL